MHACMPHYLTLQVHTPILQADVHIHAYVLATPVTLCKEWQSGSMLIPALYEKAQAPE